MSSGKPSGQSPCAASDQACSARKAIVEGGVPGFDAAVWYGMYVPVKTPAATVEKLNKELVAILQSDEMRKWLSQEGLEPVADSPAQSQEFLRKEIDRWKSVAKSAGIQAE